MDITAATTEEQLVAPVTAAKARLAAAAAKPDEFDSERLAGLVNDVAEEEGRMKVRYLALVLMQNGVTDKATIANKITRQVLMPTIGSDCWSGRKNDARRSVLDGMKAEIDQYMWGV